MSEPARSPEGTPPGLALPVVEGGFRTILADPAWSYGNSGARGGVGHEYETMTTEAICGLPVAGAAADDSVLLLWTTNPLLPDALRVVEAWGFGYKTMMTWCKPRLGVGFWLRGQTEHLIIATRGRPPLPAQPPPSVFHAAQGRHSAKPRSVYPLAERFGPAPRLELFARERRAGWVSWGDQLSRTAETSLPLVRGESVEAVSGTGGRA